MIHATEGDLLGDDPLGRDPRDTRIIAPAGSASTCRASIVANAPYAASDPDQARPPFDAAPRSRRTGAVHDEDTPSHLADTHTYTRR